jgi:Ca-activated chloride channel family protein
MVRRSVALILFCLAGLACGVGASAQAPPPVIRSSVDLVQVPFAAFDGRGRNISGLTRGDVEVYEDGARQSIELFRPQTDPAMQAERTTVVLMIDTSASVKDKLKMEQAIALDFFRKVLRPGIDQAAVVQFNSRVGLVQDFTNDLEELDAALRSLSASGTTSLYEAVQMTCQGILGHISGRKILVVLSDGDDTSSRIPRSRAVETAQRNDVTIFSVGVNTQGYRSEFASLKEFASETGGRFFRPKLSEKELVKVFGQMIDLIKQHYNIFYYSTNPKTDGSFRAIQIRLRKKNARVQHRLGYYAPIRQSNIRQY